MESVYELGELGSVLRDDVVIKELSVNLQEDTEEVFDQLAKCRSRSSSSAQLIKVEAVLSALEENTTVFDASAGADIASSLTPAVLDALALPSIAIEKHAEFTELIVPVSVIDDSNFSGLATEEEIEQSRSRSASIATLSHKTNLVLEEDQEYFIYCSQNFTSSMATDQVTNMKRIWICGELPEVMPPNFIFILTNEDEDIEERWRHRFKCPDPHSFYLAILKNEFVLSILNELETRQSTVWIKDYNSSCSLLEKLLERDTFRMFGLQPAAATSLNNKISQFMLMKDKLPLPKFTQVSVAHCVEEYDNIASESGVFVALEYGSAGSGTFHLISKQDLSAFASVLDGCLSINMCQWLTLDMSVSVDIIIAGPEEVIVYGIIEQVFDTTCGMKCMGSNYPAPIDESNRLKVTEISQACGRILANTGMRGYVSIDVSRDGPTQTWYFTEINARYPGSVSERLCMMEAARPADSLTVMDLEMLALRDGTFGGHALWPEPPLFWGRRRILAEAQFELSDTALQSIRESIKPFILLCDKTKQGDFFKPAMGPERKAQAGIFGFLEGGTICDRGATLGKLVVVAATMDERDELLNAIEEGLRSVIPCISYG